MCARQRLRRGRSSHVQGGDLVQGRPPQPRVLEAGHGRHRADGRAPGAAHYREGLRACVRVPACTHWTHERAQVVQSRKVAAHIQAPQMRAKEIADVLLEGIAEVPVHAPDTAEGAPCATCACLRDQGYPDIFVNFANSDMVGHAMTDVKDFPGVVDAILELDTQLGRVVPAALKEGYVVIISADHGTLL